MCKGVKNKCEGGMGHPGAVWVGTTASAIAGSFDCAQGRLFDFGTHDGAVSAFAPDDSFW